MIFFASVLSLKVAAGCKKISFLLFTLGRGYVILCSALHSHYLFEQVIKVLSSMNEVDVGCVDDQEGGFGVMKEVLIVGFIHRGDIIVLDLLFKGSAALSDALEEGIGVGLKKDNQIGSDDFRLQYFVYLLVQGKLVVIEIEISEYPVLGKEIITDRDPGKQVRLGHFLLLLIPVQQKEHLGLKTMPCRVFIEIRQKRVFLRLFQDQPRAQFTGDERGQTRLSDADRPFGNDIARIPVGFRLFAHDDL